MTLAPGDLGTYVQKVWITVDSLQHVLWDLQSCFVQLLAILAQTLLRPSLRLRPKSKWNKRIQC